MTVPLSEELQSPLDEVLLDAFCHVVLKASPVAAWTVVIAFLLLRVLHWHYITVILL
jgi:hypothetical protein